MIGILLAYNWGLNESEFGYLTHHGKFLCRILVFASNHLDSDTIIEYNGHVMWICSNVAISDEEWWGHIQLNWLSINIPIINMYSHRVNHQPWLYPEIWTTSSDCHLFHGLFFPTTLDIMGMSLGYIGDIMGYNLIYIGDIMGYNLIYIGDIMGYNLIQLKIYGSVSKPCTPGEHQNSW